MWTDVKLSLNEILGRSMLWGLFTRFSKSRSGTPQQDAHPTVVSGHFSTGRNTVGSADKGDSLWKKKFISCLKCQRRGGGRVTAEAPLRVGRSEQYENSKNMLSTLKRFFKNDGTCREKKHRNSSDASDEISWDVPRSGEAVHMLNTYRKYLTPMSWEAAVQNHSKRNRI